VHRVVPLPFCADQCAFAAFQNDIASIDRFQAQFSAYQPRPSSGAMYTDVDSHTAVEFLTRYPEVRCCVGVGVGEGVLCCVVLYLEEKSSCLAERSCAARPIDLQRRL